MPISKEMAKRYPADWKRRRRFIIQYRAGNRCEWCFAQNGEPHPDTGSMVVLTLAHVWDKAPENASLLNLACLCQRCHNRWDAADRRMSRIRSRVAKLLRSGQLPLAVAAGCVDGHGDLPTAHRRGTVAPAGVPARHPPGSLRVRGVNHNSGGSG